MQRKEDKLILPTIIQEYYLNTIYRRYLVYRSLKEIYIGTDSSTTFDTFTQLD